MAALTALNSAQLQAEGLQVEVGLADGAAAMSVVHRPLKMLLLAGAVPQVSFETPFLHCTYLAAQSGRAHQMLAQVQHNATPLLLALQRASAEQAAMMRSAHLNTLLPAPTSPCRQ